MSDANTGVPFVVQTAPNHIYLQIADDAYSATEAFPDDASDQVTWCAESVMETEVKYIRADLVAKLIETSRKVQEQVAPLMAQNGYGYVGAMEAHHAALRAVGGQS